MSEPVIIAENLKKVYILDKERPRTLKEYAGRLFSGRPRTSPKEINALDEISFQVERGEAVGIIGANGSGKSTLLRVLGGITRPTSGKAIISGRVASVLDLGTGFHPDLSGLDNIFLSGEMMGIRRPEIRKKIDEIIAFSELEKFMDTPVKHYSSGMFVRLAFSVIAHLDADILLMDEVISVGDASFQVKSFKKNQELLSSGKTILLVSHDLNSLSRFTSRCLYLEKGKLIGQGFTDEVIATYAESIFSVNNPEHREDTNDRGQKKEWRDKESAPGNEFITLRKILIRNENRTAEEEIFTDEKTVIEVEFEKMNTSVSINIALRINDLNGNPLFLASPLLAGEELSLRDYLSEPGHKSLTCIIQEHLFSSSVFILDFFVIDTDNIHLFYSLPYVLTFSTAYKEINGNLTLYKITNHPVLPHVNWKINQT